VAHVETESGNVHVLTLKNKKVVYTPELLQFLRKDLGVLKIWVSNRAKR
jgi:DNA polymerase-3 subunit alpha